MAILNDQITVGDIRLVVLDSDPSITTGFAAPVSSIAFVPSLGALYAKFNTADTDWTAFVGGTTNTELIQDIVGAFLQSSVEIVPTYNDAGNVETFALAVTSVTAGSYGSAGSVATFTVDSKGRITAAAATPISITASQVSDFNAAALVADRAIRSTVTTSTNTATIVASRTITSTTLLKAYITGVRPDTGATAAYERTVRVKLTAGVASISSAQSDFTDEETGMTIANVAFSVSGAVVNAQVFGVSTVTINWTCELKAYF